MSHLMGSPSSRCQTKGILALIVAGVVAVPVVAGPINSDVAFTPREGGTILRLQYTFEEADGNGSVQHISRSTLRGVFVYGLRSNIALIMSVPFVNRQIDRFHPRTGRFEDAHDGVGDVTLLVKYRFWQKDTGVRQTTRLAALAGLQIRSGDSDFSSDSYDPIVGLAYSWRHNRAKWDADLVYQFNTGGGEARHDTLRYDLSYSYRIHPQTYDEDTPYEIDLVAELNGRYSTNGSHTVYLSPGVTVGFGDWSMELSVQLPALQDLADNPPETDYRFVAGFRFRW